MALSAGKVALGVLAAAFPKKCDNFALCPTTLRKKLTETTLGTNNKERVCAEEGQNLLRWVDCSSEPQNGNEQCQFVNPKQKQSRPCHSRVRWDVTGAPGGQCDQRDTLMMMAVCPEGLRKAGRPRVAWDVDRSSSHLLAGTPCS